MTPDQITRLLSDIHQIAQSLQTLTGVIIGSSCIISGCLLSLTLHRR